MRGIRVIVLLLSIISPVFAWNNNQQEDVPYFTDQDLKRYKKPADTNKSPVESNSEGDTAKTGDNSTDNRGAEPKLNRYEVPYKAYGGISRRIIIPVMFNGSVTAPMALDTGAPGMHISYRLAGKLGILDNDKGMLWIEAKGIGGTVPAIYTIIDTIQVGGAKDHFVPTVVSPSISSHFEGLIGMDFMVNFSVKIDTRKRVVVFEELPPRPNMPAGHDETWWRINFHRFASMRSEWKKYREMLEKESSDSERIKELKEVADRQYQEADKLFNRLNGYASEHAVPMDWREY